MTASTLPPLSKAALSVSEFCRVCSIGRTSFYEAVKTGRISIRKMGTRTLVPVGEVDRFLNSLDG